MPNLNYSFTLKGELLYTHFEELNHGGFGITYKAKANFFHGRIKQILTFAVKEYFPKDYAMRNDDGSVSSIAGKEADFQECLDEFLREGKMLHDLNHKGIVPVNEVIEANGTVYYVMQYLGDMSLTRYVSEQGGKLSEDEAKRIMDALLDAVGYLHQQRLNHLDIKPDNVMMVESEEGVRTPVLIDFGVSKHFHDNGKQTSRFGGKGVTEGFSPMEQYVGITTFSPKADIYALGATFFYMLTGKIPKRATEVSEAWIRENLLSDVSQETTDAICRAMSLDFTRRTADVRDFYKKEAYPKNSEKSEQNKVEPIKKTERIEDSKTIKGQTDKPQPGTQKMFVTGADNDTGKNKTFTKYILVGVLAVVALVGLVYAIIWNDNHSDDINPETSEDTSTNKTDENGNIDFTVNGVSFKMIHVEGGTFQMGATPEQGGDAENDEKPAHSVTLDDYMIGETEVTQALWEAVMGTTVSQQRDKADKSYNLRGEGKDYPMYYVSWNECQEFIKKLNTLTGEHFRLPTEAEWEFAARGGNKSGKTKYSGSKTIDDVAWYWKNSGDKYLSGTDSDWSSDKVKANNCKTHPVRTKKANELGIYDMSGNVWEWCEDWFGEYDSIPKTNPKRSDKGSNRVFRGGSWLDFAWYCRVSLRRNRTPDICYYDLGFRLAL